MKRVISTILTVIMLAGVIIVPGVTASATDITDIKTGTLVTFGSYPQTSVTDPSLLARLNSQSLNWTYYDYYCEGKQEDYMKYADVTLSGARYRAVTFTHYRTPYTQRDNGYEPDKVYWFRYDPIVWRVLDVNGGLLMAENLIDSQPFHNVSYMKDDSWFGDESYKYYASDWKYSSLKKWLNGVFYDVAFSSEAKKVIISERLESPSSESSEFEVQMTNDTHVFLLTYVDVLNKAYGFSSSNKSGADTNRIAYGTDYARCQGLSVYDSTEDYYSGASDWLLRTPSCDFGYSEEVLYDGNISGNDYTINHIGFGIRPTLYVDNLQSAISEGIIKITDSNNLVINGPMGTDPYEIFSGYVRYPEKDNDREKDDDSKKGKSREYKCQYTYSDEYFSRSSSEYNQDLAMTSLAFEYAACVPDGYVEKTLPLAEEFFGSVGFDVYECYGYDANLRRENLNGVACIVGYKNITVAGKDAKVIGCAIRGGGYMEEWGGNFIMGTDTQHEGFDIASETVLDHINKFINDKHIPLDSNVYFWVTGYSRAAAIANLTAAKLNNGTKDYGYIRLLKPNKSKVFCYTFETPKCTTDANAASPDYDNIFNMVNPNDIVPKVPPYYGDFRFTRYGQSYYFPARETTSGYGELLKRYKNKYQESCPEGYVYSEEFEFLNRKGEKNDKIGQMTFGNNLVKFITTGALKDRKNYVDNYQDALSKLIAVVAGGYHTEENSSKELIHNLTKDIDAYCKKYKNTYTLIASTIISDDIGNLISENLHKYTELSDEEIDELVSQVKPHIQLILIFYQKKPKKSVMLIRMTIKHLRCWFIRTQTPF